MAVSFEYCMEAQVLPHWKKAMFAVIITKTRSVSSSSPLLSHAILLCSPLSRLLRLIQLALIPNLYIMNCQELRQKIKTGVGRRSSIPECLRSLFELLK